MGEAVGLLQVLGGEEDGDALLGAEAVHVAPDRLAADGVQAGGGLVKEEDGGAVDEGGGEVEAAFHPTRVGADGAVGGVLEVDDGEELVDALAAGATAQSEEPRLEREQFAAGLDVVEAGLLQGDADAAAHGARLGEDVEAVDTGGAGGGAEEGGEHTDGRRLARAVLAEEAEDGAGSDVEVDPVDGAHRVEVLRQSLGPDGAHPCERSAVRATGKRLALCRRCTCRRRG